MNITKITASLLVAFLGVGGIINARAQAVDVPSNIPSIDNNVSGVCYPPGWYMNNGQRNYYYSNGTYYSADTNSYGNYGNEPHICGRDNVLSSTAPNTTSNANEINTSGNYSGQVNRGQVTPGAPNTGAGGGAAANWAILLSTAAIAIGGMTYVKNQIAVR